MEPSHSVFVSTHQLLDAKGEPLPPLLPKRAVSAGTNDEQPEEVLDSNASVLSAFSDDPSLIRSTYSEGHRRHDPAYAMLGASTADDESAPSLHSVYTMQSVLLADGVRFSQQLDDETLLAHLPERYHKGSVKAKITWFGALCLAGIGMFVQAFVIITTGQIKTVWDAEYPECWDTAMPQSCPNLIQCCDVFPNTPVNENGQCMATFAPTGFCREDGTYPDELLCNQRVTSSVSYSGFAGIMAGMVIMGILVDWIGRKKSGTITSILMLVGIGGMVLFQSSNTSTLFITFSSFFAVFGFGVGGEYPLSASSAAAYHAQNTEKAILDDQDQHERRVLMEAAKTVRRGETISIIFAMQGLGAVAGSLMLLVLVYVANQSRIDCEAASSNSSGNNSDALSGIWRGFYLIGLLFVSMLLLYRWLILEEGSEHDKVVARKKRREKHFGKNSSSRWKILRFYAPRLIGTGGNWFFSDVAFFGLKLFSGPIFAAINPQGDLVVQNGWLLFSNLCALAGYYVCAQVIDIPWIGRSRLQMFSFVVCAVLFITTGSIFRTAKAQTLMFLFFASSFFVQVGANVTTYVMAAETYPTELRATCHGLSAFMGKAGALVATIVFAHLDVPTIFWTCGATSIIGLLLTLVFSVDLTRVSLAEHDAQLELFIEGKLHVYKGKLNAPEHLSYFEQWTGRHGEFDPLWASKLMDRQKSAKLLSASLQHSRMLPSTVQVIEEDDLTVGRINQSPVPSPVASAHKRSRMPSPRSAKSAVFPSLPEEEADLAADRSGVAG